MELVTNLNAIREHHPCESGWAKLLRHLGKTKADDEPLPFAVILEANGIEDALWCCRTAPQYGREWRLFAVWSARQVVHLMPDPACVAALDVAERFVYGLASEAELSAAESAAWGAASAAWSAADAADAAAEVDAADAAAEAAAAEVVRSAAAAAAAVRSAAWSGAAAAKVAKRAQFAAFRHLVTTGSLEGFQ